MSGPEIVTLGCRLNAAESEAMRALAGDQDDLVIINSCAVTAEAVKQARQAIRRAAAPPPRRAHPRHRLRGADRAGHASRRCPRSTAVIGNREKREAAMPCPLVTERTARRSTSRDISRA